MSRLHFLPILGLIFTLTLIMGNSTRSWAQAKSENQAPQIYVIETTEGEIFEGPAVERTDEYIVLNTTKLGYIRIFFRDIDSMQRVGVREAKNIVKEEKKVQYVTPSHYLLAPTAFSTKKERGYYQNTWILINQAGYGFSDNFSLGGGFIPVFASGSSDVPVWIMPKFSIPLVEEQIELSVGSLNLWTLGTYNSGIVYSKIAFGGTRSHISIGTGFGYENNKVMNGMLFTFDGLLKVGDKATLTAENYALGDLGIYMIGYHQPVLEAILDFGIVVINDEFDVFGVPYLGITVPFGK